MRKQMKQSTVITRRRESVLASHRTMKWDGIPHHTCVGKGALSRIHCLSARTARNYARPTKNVKSLSEKSGKRGTGVRNEKSVSFQLSE
jgi:hypothetical protein